MENLHPDISIRILSRLPVESVLECRRVCKTWRTLLLRQNFVDAHIRHQLLHLDHHGNHIYHNHSNNCGSAKVSFLFLIGLTRGSGSQLYYGEYVKQNPQQMPYMKLKKIINYPPLNQNQCLVGSCNGLICFSLCHSYHRPTYICNPITKEYMNVPRFDISQNNYIMGTCGFGYHASTNEYKVVTICYIYNQPLGHVNVFTLGGSSGSKGRWRKKEDTKYSLALCGSPGILANGSLHWIDLVRSKIVSFDLAEEQFSLVESPPCFETRRVLSGIQLLLLGGCLCVVYNDMRSGSVDIWLLKKNNSSNHNIKKKECESWSWIREFSIAFPGTEEGDYELVSLTNGGELILWNINNDVLYCYDPKTTTLEELSLGYGDKNSKIWEVLPHMNSFVSLKDLGEEDAIKIKQTRKRTCS